MPKPKKPRSITTSTSSVERRELFCQHFCVSFNALDAAKQVGWGSPQVKSALLMREPGVQARIREIIEARVAQIQSTEFPVLAKIREVVDRCMVATPVTGPRGKVIDGQWTFDATGALRGLELLGKHEGLFPARMDINVTEAKARDAIQRALKIVSTHVTPEVFRAIVADLEGAGDA